MGNIILTDATGKEKYRPAPMEEIGLVTFIAKALVMANAKQKSVKALAWEKMTYESRKKWLELSKVACDCMIAYDGMMKVGTNEEN